MRHVHKIRVPTPFPVGPTNVWLIEGKPLTIVDTGPLTDEAMAGLEAGLAEHGHRVEDIERIIISHGHIDHFGLAARIKQRANAQLILHVSERRMVEDFTKTHERMFAYYRERSLRAGFPQELLDKSNLYFDIFYQVAQDVKVDHVLQEGDELDSGIGPLRVLHCPGHTPGSISLHAEREKLLFSGDNLLRDITTNPFFGGSERHKVGLIYYIPTLERLQALELARVLPGHGADIEDATSLINKVRHHHAVRGEMILDVLQRGAQTPYQVMRSIFPKLPMSEVWLALADTMGHIELLEQEGRIRTVDDRVSLTG